MKKFAQAGACSVHVEHPFPTFINSTETIVVSPIYCALDPSQCFPALGKETFFQSSTQVSEFCETSHQIGFQTTLGRCKSDQDLHVCTGDASVCYTSSDFEPHSDYCTLLADTWRHRQVERSYFGSCDFLESIHGGGHRFSFSHCYWSKDECDYASSDERTTEWMGLQLDQQCTCENTRVGACYGGGEYTCAVSSAACDSQSTYVSHLKLLNEKDIDCRLCEVPEELPPKVGIFHSKSNAQTGLQPEPDVEDFLNPFTLVFVAGTLFLVIISAVWIIRVLYQKRQDNRKGTGDVPLDWATYA